MKKSILALSVVGVLLSCNNEEKNTSKLEIKYPETKKADQTDTYFNQEVKDPYRWLEDDRSTETEAWVKAQNKVTFDYLEKIDYRDKLKNQLEDIWNYEKIGAPFKRGDYTYFYKNDGLQNQSVLYRYKNDEQPENAEVFLDPNKFSEKGTTSLGGMSFSEDGKKLAYAISEGGSDWRKIIVIETENKKQLEDTLVDVKFSGISWKANDGFFYSSYDKPEGSELSAKTDQHKLYYHKLETPQSNDQVIFGEKPEEKHRYVSGNVSEDNRFLYISASKSTSGNKLFIKKLNDENSDLISVVDHYENDISVLENRKDTLYISTNLDAPNNRVVKVNANNPSPENWEDFIPETENVLSASTGGSHFFGTYMVDAISKVKHFDENGELIKEVDLPGIGSVSGFGSRKEEQTIYYSFTNYTTPSSIYKYDIKARKSELFVAPDIQFNPEEFESKQVFYTSKDGTKVPMIITHKKGIELDGTNPTMLYAYGGFNISLTPSFSTANAVWLQNGGVYAVANLRGGGEYGKEWHKAGTKLQKQNVFDDFIAAAEFLIDENYTSSNRLAVRGGSNGGLLVGATMTQRPDLMQVALPAVGVLDMLRYHTFTSGAGWAYDYGTAEDNAEMFDYLYAYSPLHNIKKGVDYPATLITTGDHDDRVVPAHSFKFAAELQAKQSGKNPTLIRIETDAGHGAGKPTSKIIEEYADIFAFTLFNMGIESL
ncbi:MAG: prolyl oligopeptidase family serine peptidase [Bacteroidota bacterium]